MIADGVSTIVLPRLSRRYVGKRKGFTVALQTPPRVGAGSGQTEGDEREWLRRVVEANPDPIITLDANGRVVELNPAAERLLGYERTELIGEVFGELVVSEPLRADFWSCLLRTVSGEEEEPGHGLKQISAMRRGGEELSADLISVQTGESPLLITIFMRAAGIGPRIENASAAPAAKLSDRERQIISLAAEGHAGPEIAEHLVVSPATVKSHFQNIYEKLGVSNRGAAVAKAMRLGLII